jgi:histidinol-phosphate aminotransferase
MTTSIGGLRFRDGVRAAARYVPDWLGVDRSELIRLDRNESTRPLSPHLASALTEHLTVHGVHSYPDVEELTAAIASYCRVSDSEVLATNGSDQAIDLCLRAFLRPGDTMLVARPEFAIFGHTAGLLEATIRGVSFGPDLEFPYDDFASALTTRPDLIVFINPNNPTGTPVDLSFVEKTASAWPDVPVIVDEAYFEFTGATAVPLIETYPNLIVLRTFSKAFAMAGLRLGYVVANPDVVNELAKLRNPFDINALAAVAGRVQLSRPDEMRAYVRQLTTVVKPATVDFFRQRGVPIWPGAANFVVVRPLDADATITALRDAGILVRRMGGPLLTGTLRMSIGTSDEMTHVLDVFESIMDTTGSVR